MAKAPTVEKLWADGGYQGPKLRAQLEKMGLGEALEIIEKPKRASRFSTVAGWWNAPLPGCHGAVAWRRITNGACQVLWHGLIWPYVGS